MRAVQRQANTLRDIALANGVVTQHLELTGTTLATFHNDSGSCFTCQLIVPIKSKIGDDNLKGLNNLHAIGIYGVVGIVIAVSDNTIVLWVGATYYLVKVPVVLVGNGGNARIFGSHTL